MSKTYKDYPLLPNNRINFSKISGSLELPNLVEVQTNSYKWFLEKGLDEVLREIFPIANYSEDVFIEYLSSELREPKYPFLECKERKKTYQAPLYARLALRYSNKNEVKEHDIYLGDIPLMTESRTFIVNGAERVIVSQIVRSPGAYLSNSVDPKTGKSIYEADLIPTHGSWLQFETDLKGMVNVRINRQKKMPATTFLKALGLDDEKQLIKLFGDSEIFTTTIEKNRDVYKMELLGVDEFGSSSINYAIVLECTPMSHIGIKRETLKLIKQIFDEDKIEIPFNQLDVHIKEK